jgi:hypothetical protein
MKLVLNYLNDNKGNIQAVQVPFSEWQRLLSRLKKYEQTLKIKSDISEAFEEVKKMQSGKMKKQSLSAFLNEL